MIRSAKEATEAIKIWDAICDDCAHKEIPIPDDDETTRKQMVFLISKGYLAALQGPEVKALEIYCQHFKTCKSGLSRNKPCTCGFDDALAQYREAVKP